MKLKWGDVHRVEESILAEYPDGPRLDLSDPAFIILSASINVTLTTIPLEICNKFKSIHTVKGDAQTDAIVITYDDIQMPPRKLKVCNNSIVSDIPGNIATVLNAGKLYVESMMNDSVQKLEAFKGAWKYELYRVLGPMVPECAHLKVFSTNRNEK